jgi:hypothetical protein
MLSLLPGTDLTAVDPDWLSIYPAATLLPYWSKFCNLNSDKHVKKKHIKLAREQYFKSIKYLPSK